MPRPDDSDDPVVVPVFDGGTSFAKWAGQPSSGGLGGSLYPSSGKDANYDPDKKPRPFDEVGASGLAQYGGFIRDEFLTQLQGDNWVKTVREMIDNDPVIGALLFAIQMLIRKVEWRVEPPEAPSVEDIVEERIAERQQQMQERQMAVQQRQAAMAGQQQPGAGAHAGTLDPSAPGSIPRRAGMASGPPSTPFHQPTNAPATPDGPGSNPSGGPAQAAAMQGDGGLPALGGGKSSLRKSMLERARRMFTKESSGNAGDIGSGDVDQEAPTDPETGEAMVFPIGAGPMDITPEARKGLELAVMVETCLHDLDVSWADLLSQIVTFIFFGFAIHETVYKKRNGPNPDYPEQGSRYNDGKIGWAKIAGRAQETRHRWEFEPESGDVLGMWQLAPPRYQLRYIPLQKALLFRTTAYKGNPEGRSVVRPAYRPWYFKKRIEEYEAIGVERDLAGLPVAHVPYEWMSDAATPGQRAALEEVKKIVRNLRRNEQEGVVFPTMVDPESKTELFKLELLSAPSRRQFDADKIITRYEQRMAMTVLADFILLGHDGGGNRSLGETKSDLFTSALETFLNVIADVFNTYAIPRLMQMNGEDPAMSPRLTFGSLDRISITEIGALVTALAGAGADLFPDTELEDALRERAGLPPKATSKEL